MNKDFEDDESDRDHAQDGQEPVETVQEVSGETQKDNKEKKSGSKPYSPTVQCNAIQNKKSVWARITIFFRNMRDEDTPVYAPFFGVMGATSAMVFCGESRSINIML